MNYKHYKHHTIDAGIDSTRSLDDARNALAEAFPGAEIYVSRSDELDVQTYCDFGTPFDEVCDVREKAYQVLDELPPDADE